MRFKLEFGVHNLLLAEGASLEFSFRGPHALGVRLWTPITDEQGKWYMQGDTYGVATSEREPNSNISAMFERLAAGELPPGSTIDTKWVGWVHDEQGHIFPDHTAPAQVLPLPFQSFIRDLTGELWDYARRTVLLVRWRGNSMGQHHPFFHRDMLWSLDGAHWSRLPGFASVRVTDSGGVPPLSDVVHNEIQELIQAGKTEPLGHELYREAWEQRGGNPRSALILGIAAAEAGFKQFVGILVPDARWLAENAPSPPLVDMLEQYLPKLPVRNTFAGKIKAPPLEILKVLRKGVRLRNELSHRGVASLEPDTLEEVLLAVRDVLWLLDYYTGFDWAVDYITLETRRALMP